MDRLELKPEIKAALERDRWTVARLATATAKQLTPYPGIGSKTAEDIIAKAQALVNADKLSEAQHLEQPVQPEEPEPAMSVRVRRIREAAKQ